MDRKSIAVIAICFLLLASWSMLMNKVYPPIHVPVTTNQVAGVTNVGGLGTNSPELAAATNAPVAAAVTSVPAAPAPAKFIAQTNIPEELLTVTNANVRAVFTSHGGGLKQLFLLQYPETTSSLRKRKSADNEVASLNAANGPPVLAMAGDEATLGDGVFKLSPIPSGVRAEKTLANGLIVTKEFQLSSNYLISATVRQRNGNAQPLALPAQSWFVGTATPMGPQDRATGVRVMAFDGAKAESYGMGDYFNTNRTMLMFFPRTPKTEYQSTSTNVLWTSAQNQFFVLATMPEKPAAGLHMRVVDLPPPAADELAANPSTVPNPHGLQATLTMSAVNLAANQELTNHFTLYAGPKNYDTVQQLGQQFHNELDRVMGFGFFAWFAVALLGTMNWFHNVLLMPYGWAIVTITVLIKVVFWPLTQYSTKSMKRMQTLGPQIKLLQEKYKDDPQKLQAKTWEFYKKNGANPFSGCLPMLIQLPVLWGFYGMLQNAIQLRGAPFLWIGDLSKPDTIFILPFLNFPVNPMPLIMGATMLWQSHLTPPSPGMDPAQQRMMRYMPLLFLVFLYNFSSGLALYWTVQNLLSILQTQLINRQMPPVAAATVPAAAVPVKKK